MENRKLYSQMSPAEQSVYSEELQTYITDSLPLLTSPATTADAVKAQRAALMLGFSLATAFPFCREFVRERILFGDFSPAVCQRLSQYFQEILRQTSQPSNIPAFQPSNRQTAKRHVGRPTKQESKEYERELAAKEQHENTIHPSAFPQPADTPSSAIFNITMREYRWLLSPSLQKDVDGLRDYRTTFSDASQKAKFLAEQYGTSATRQQKEEIAQYAEEAKKTNAIIEQIYQSADRELAEACLRLKYDPHYIKQMADRGVNTEELRQALVPKYKVVIAANPTFKQSVLDKIHEEDPVLAKQRKILAEAKAEVDAIRKYMLRTDKPATDKRIATMEKRLVRLRELDKAHPELKVEPDAYIAVINKTKAELSQK